MDRTIFNIEARGNVFLEVMVEQFGMNLQESFDAIHGSFDTCVTELQSIGVSYLSLKNALVPMTDKKEIAFVFDSVKTGSDAYGDGIWEMFIPLMGTESCNSVLCGDLITIEGASQYLPKEFRKSLVQLKPTEARYSKNFSIL